jgi:ABC-type amino acid transport system permease subunit
MKFRYLQTIMSTDIVHFTNNKEDFSFRALQIYLAVTIPFMALTFGAWRVLYVFTRKRGRNTEKEKGRPVASGDYSMV